MTARTRRPAYGRHKCECLATGNLQDTSRVQDKAKRALRVSPDSRRNCEDTVIHSKARARTRQGPRHEGSCFHIPCTDRTYSCLLWGSTSSVWLLAYLVIAAILPIVSSAPTSHNFRSTRQTKGGFENEANILITETGKLYSEICLTPNLCRSSVEHLLRIDLKLPEIKDIESGCLSIKFNKEKCLPKIYSDLLKFQTYLDFLKESMPSSKNTIEFIQVKSISLANRIKHKVEIPSEDKEDTTTGITVVDLTSKDAWNQNLTTYIILQSFMEYMEKAARALRNSEKVSK
ncbi:interleukin-6 [Dendrobates tinctorius]|uniref:interleukin-6 n=1 Tax=Dendrobates tinctorius TaxID=92724 RepID=UPI003CC9AE62